MAGSGKSGWGRREGQERMARELVGERGDVIGDTGESGEENVCRVLRSEKAVDAEPDGRRRR